MQNALGNMSREQLLEVVLEFQGQAMEFQEQTLQKQGYIQQLETELADIRFQLEQYKRMIFASKRERFINNMDENQLTLPFEVEEGNSLGKDQQVISYVKSKNKKKGHPGLLAQVMIDKFVDHLPIYRQVERFKREGVKISKSTINGWQESVCNLLEPLYDTLRHRVLSQGYLQVDETPIKVLDKNTKGKTHRGYHWVYYSPLEKTVFFDYNNGRSREGPKRLLKGFTGYLQTDGYVAYDIFGETEGTVHLNCMAHARRGFEKALDYDKKRAGYAMEMFQKLYEVERTAREENYTPEKRYDLRIKKSLPILNDLEEWIVDAHKVTIPKSPLGKALDYCMNRWENLMAYLLDGSLEIDNNLAENAIRPIALGRKNYLFAGSERGAQRAAMFYSFFGTCKKNGVNPYDWLKNVLEVIPDYKVNRLTELLPQHMKM